MILGGVPRRSLLSVIGGAGTGKTTFALQFLNEALESDRKGVYITLEQTRESILSTAEEKGWSFREHAEADRLARWSPSTRSRWRTRWRRSGMTSRDSSPSSTPTGWCSTPSRCWR